jgi:trk system potassium uptake protein TrkH
VRRAALHWESIRRVFGFLLVLLSVSMLLPLFWALYYRTPDAMAFAWSMLIVGIPGLLLLRRKEKETRLGSRESFVVVTGGWLLCSIAGAVPFIISGVLPNPLDALFEAISGFTTTGATVMSRIEVPAAGILFWRSFLNWLGGMGIILAFLAIVPMANQGSDPLFRAELPGMEVARFTPRLRQSVVLLWRIYGVITVLQAVCLLLAGMSLYEALIHTFSTVATGGYSNRALSVGAFQSPWIRLIILFFMFVSGVNFSLYYKAVHTRKLSVVFKDPEFRAYTAVILAATAIIVLNLSGTHGLMEGLRHGPFQVVSVITTTGYTTADFDLWPDLSRAVLLLLMFFGACSGSTAGAIKIARLMVAAKAVFRELGQMVHSRAVLPVRVGNRVIPESTVRNVLVFIAIYLACAMAGTFYMLWLGLDIVSALSAVATTLGNVGPGLGLVGPAQSFAAVPLSGKMVLSFLMLLGRLELFTVFVILTPTFWKR